jgi:hypothetical protein
MVCKQPRVVVVKDQQPNMLAVSLNLARKSWVRPGRKHPKVPIKWWAWNLTKMAPSKVNLKF